MDINPYWDTALRKLSNLRQLRKRTKWSLVSLFVVLVLGLSYVVLRFSTDLGWFEQYGTLGAFLIAFITNITILFPVPGFAIVWAIAASTANWILVALAAGVGAGLGEITAYLAGRWGAVLIDPDKSIWYKRAAVWMERYGNLTVFIFSFTWLPFDLAGIAAGALRYPFRKFLLWAVAGRVLRYLLECYLAHLGWGIWSNY
jgi:membrane protein YqaA with SNARE-associated domain